MTCGSPAKKEKKRLKRTLQSYRVMSAMKPRPRRRSGFVCWSVLGDYSLGGHVSGGVVIDDGGDDDVKFAAAGLDDFSESLKLVPVIVRVFVAADG